MKKILLLIVPLLLMFGLVKAEIYSVTVWSWVTSNLYQNYMPKTTLYCKLYNCYLSSVTLWTWNSCTGSAWLLNSTGWVITSWLFNWMNVVFNTNLTKDTPYFISYSNSTTQWWAGTPWCNMRYWTFQTSQDYMYIATGLILTPIIINLSPTYTYVVWNAYVTYNYSWNLLSTTIYYNNWLSFTWFNDSTIYLNWLVPTISYSGSAIVFNYLQNIYRALFKSH